jgi:hypothetical protein
MRRRLIALLAALALMIVLVSGVLFSSIPVHEHATISTPANYAGLVTMFPPELRAFVPESIPVNATSISGTYTSASGLGPSSSRLKVKFTLPPERAAELLETCKSVSRSRLDRRTESPNALDVFRDDQLASIRTDPATGEISVELWDN